MSKRKVTVEASKAANDDKKKPSVFERLGRSFDNSEAHTVRNCRNWVETGECPYGNKCRFRHPGFSGKSKNFEDSDDLRLKMKSKRDKSGSPPSSPQRSKKKDKESKIKSTVVVSKGERKGESESEVEVPDEQSGLDFAEELALMKERQALLRQLQETEGGDSEFEKVVIEKQITSEESEIEVPHRKHKKKKDKEKEKVMKSPEINPHLQSPPVKKHKKKEKGLKTPPSAAKGGPRTPSPDFVKESKKEKKRLKSLEESDKEGIVVKEKHKKKHKTSKEREDPEPWTTPEKAHKHKKEKKAVVSRSPSVEKVKSKSKSKRSLTPEEYRRGEESEEERSKKSKRSLSPKDENYSKSKSKRYDTPDYERTRKRSPEDYSKSSTKKDYDDRDKRGRRSRSDSRTPEVVEDYKDKRERRGGSSEDSRRRRSSPSPDARYREKRAASPRNRRERSPEEDRSRGRDERRGRSPGGYDRGRGDEDRSRRRDDDYRRDDERYRRENRRDVTPESRGSGRREEDSRQRASSPREMKAGKRGPSPEDSQMSRSPTGRRYVSPSEERYRDRKSPKSPRRPPSVDDGQEYEREREKERLLPHPQELPRGVTPDRSRPRDANLGDRDGRGGPREVYDDRGREKYRQDDPRDRSPLRSADRYDKRERYERYPDRRDEGDERYDRPPDRRDYREDRERYEREKYGDRRDDRGRDFYQDRGRGRGGFRGRGGRGRGYPGERFDDRGFRDPRGMPPDVRSRRGDWDGRRGDDRYPMRPDDRGPPRPDERGLPIPPRPDDRGLLRPDERGPPRGDDRGLQRLDERGPYRMDDRGPHRPDERGPPPDGSRERAMYEDKGREDYNRKRYRDEASGSRGSRSPPYKRQRDLSPTLSVSSRGRDDRERDRQKEEYGRGGDRDRDERDRDRQKEEFGRGGDKERDEREGRDRSKEDVGRDRDRDDRDRDRKYLDERYREDARSRESTRVPDDRDQKVRVMDEGRGTPLRDEEKSKLSRTPERREETVTGSSRGQREGENVLSDWSEDDQHSDLLNRGEGRGASYRDSGNREQEEWRGRRRDDSREGRDRVRELRDDYRQRSRPSSRERLPPRDHDRGRNEQTRHQERERPTEDIPPKPDSEVKEVKDDVAIPEEGSTEVKELPPDVSTAQEGEDKKSSIGGNLEYDEISDNELDEILATEETEQEEEVTPAPVDILDIDWRSLVAETIPKPEVKKSALKRFSPANVFASIGVSKALAGEELYEKIINTCQNQLEQEAALEEKEAPPEGNTVENKQSQKEHPKFTFLSDIAAFHASAAHRRKERAKLMADLGPYTQALCARRDLHIRRKLCKFDKASELSSVFPAPAHDPELYKQSLQLLKQPKNINHSGKNTVNVTA